MTGDLYNGKNNDFLRIQGGTSNNPGSRLALSGPNHSSMPGEFWLVAKDGNQTKELVGKPNGTLTWSGTYNGVTLTSGKYITSDNAGGTWVQIAKDKSILNSTNSTGAYGWLNGFTKSYKVMLGAYPQSTELVYLQSFTKANIDSGTNTVNKSITWNSETGELINAGTIKINKDSSSAPNNGGLTITGGKQTFAIQIQTNGVTKGTAPSAVVHNGIEFYGNTMTKYQNRLGVIEQSVSTANVSSIGMYAFGCAAAETTTNCSISCNVDASGNAYTAAPTPATTDSSTKIATTAYVKAQGYATLASPALTGTPTAPTAAVATNNTQIATTAFVKSALSTWNAVTVTAVTSYCASAGGNYMSVYQNPYLKLCCVGFNIQLAATTIPGSTAIINGFPKALHNFGCVCMDSSGVGIRMYISTTGSLMLDGAKTLSSSTWVNGSVTYPYSSL